MKNEGWICPRCEAVISPTMNFCPLCSGTKSQRPPFDVAVGDSTGIAIKDESKGTDNSQQFLVENQ